MGKRAGWVKFFQQHSQILPWKSNKYHFDILSDTSDRSAEADKKKYPHKQRFCNKSYSRESPPISSTHHNKPPLRMSSTYSTIWQQEQEKIGAILKFDLVEASGLSLQFSVLDGFDGANRLNLGIGQIYHLTPHTSPLTPYPPFTLQLTLPLSF